MDREQSDNEFDAEAFCSACESVRRKWERSTGDRMLAEDLAQDTALIALERLAGAGLKAPEKLAAFLHQTARYLHIGHIRRSARQSLLPPEQLESFPDPHRSPEASVSAGETAQLLSAILASLNAPRDRELLTRVLICQQQKHEVCDALELSTSHYDRVCYRAKTRAASEARRALAGADAGR